MRIQCIAKISMLNLTPKCNSNKWTIAKFPINLLKDWSFNTTYQFPFYFMYVINFTMRIIGNIMSLNTWHKLTCYITRPCPPKHDSLSCSNYGLTLMQHALYAILKITFIMTYLFTLLNSYICISFIILETKFISL